MVTDQIKRKLESKFIQAQGKVGEFLLESGKINFFERNTFVRNMSFPLLCTWKPVCELYCTLKKCKVVSVFTSGYVNKETILHFFYKITNERGTKTVFTYAHVKWFYSQSERAYYLNYFIIPFFYFHCVLTLNSSVHFSDTKVVGLIDCRPSALFCTVLAALGPHCYYHGPILPGKALTLG